ncbi:3926_t:CDS:2, partial [Gigaspora rosea]
RVQPFYNLLDPQIIILISKKKRENQLLIHPQTMLISTRNAAKTTIDFITNKIEQQQLEYSDEDDNLNEDDCCAECENTTDT